MKPHTIKPNASFTRVNNYLNSTLRDFAAALATQGLVANSSLPPGAQNTRNTHVGQRSMTSLTTGSNNTAVGNDILTKATAADNNVAMGDGNLAVLTTGGYNTAIGALCMRKCDTGTNNVAIGSQTMDNLTTGINNTGVGADALKQLTTGTGNTCMGRVAGFDLNGANTNNTIIGFDTGRGVSTGNNNTILGANIKSLAAALSNNIIIADGLGNIKYRWDGTINAITGGLQVNSTTDGFFVPRMTNAQRTAIATPATGMMVFCTDATEGLYIKLAAGWKMFTAS